MQQHTIPRSIWLVTVLTALVFGIWPGVAFAQGNWVFFGVVFGWAYFPLALSTLTTQGFNADPTIWAQLLAACGYPLAMLGYSVCAYLAMRHTSLKRTGFRLVLVALSISTLASIPANVIAPGMFQPANKSSLFSSDLSALVLLHGIILVHLVIAAMLGWGIGIGLLRLHGRNKALAHGAMS